MFPHSAIPADGDIGRGTGNRIRKLDVAGYGIGDVHFDTSFSGFCVLRAGAAFAGRKDAFRAGSEGTILHTLSGPSAAAIG